MEISGGIIESAQKIVVYGPEGIGKSYFASKFPGPIFCDTEGSTKHMNVKRTPKPSSWTMLLEQVNYFKRNPQVCDTLVIDTADWAERLCMSEICDKAKKDSIESFGYGKGYTYLAEEFGRLLNLLEELVELGINVVLTAHAQMRKFEQPDEMGSYDRWEMKLQKKTAPMVKEWADMVLFANYKTYVINVDDQGAAKGKNKAQGGKRIIHTSHHPCWDAKNRHDLKDELPFDFKEIKNCIPVRNGSAATVSKPAEPVPAPATPEQEKTAPPAVETPPAASIPKPLADLMAANNVEIKEIQAVVGSKGYYPADTPIENYDPQFITGVLVGAWPKVLEMILVARDQEFCDEDSPY